MNRPIRLLIYSHYFAPSVGGVESVVESLARGLAAFRCPDASPEFLVVVATGVPADGINDGEFPFSVHRQPHLLRLRQLIRSSDLVHCAGPALLPMALAWLARKPFVVEHHVYQAICPNGLLLQKPQKSVCPGHFQNRHYAACLRCLASDFSAARGILAISAMFPRRFLSRRASANVAVSSHVARRIPFPRTRTIYHGVADAGLSIVPDSAFLDPASPLCFAYVGRFIEEKGIAVLLEAAARLRHRSDFRLRLVGDGPQRSHLQEIIATKQLGGRVTITGYLRGEELTQALSDVAVVVMPSTCEETAGLAAMEQMMRGRVVIGSQLGALAEIIGDAGLKFAPGDAASLAACMEQVLDRRSEMPSIGNKARESALNLFSLRRMIHEHAALFRRLLTAGGC